MNASDVCDLIPLQYYMERIRMYEEEGYKIVVNATKEKVIDYFNEYVYEMSIEQAIAVANSAYLTITSRSGLSDLLAFSGCNLEIIYPNRHFWNMYNFKKTFGIDKKEIVL